MFRRIVPALVAMIAALDRPSRSASPTATISGVVRDSSGSTVPGANVRAINETTTALVRGVQRREGRLHDRDAGAGAYRVEVTLDGFDTVSKRIELVRRAVCVGRLRRWFRRGSPKRSS